MQPVLSPGGAPSGQPGVEPVWAEPRDRRTKTGKPRRGDGSGRAVSPDRSDQICRLIPGNIPSALTRLHLPSPLRGLGIYW